jgi:hypothetical protein
MKLQKLLSIALLLGIFILNSGAGCSSKTDDPQPDNFQSLLGKWEALTYDRSYVTLEGKQKNDQGEIKAKVIWEFLQDGRLITTDGNNSREVRWKLSVEEVADKNIAKGKLTLIGDEEKKLAALLGQVGDLTYNIYTYNLLGTPHFKFSVDASKLEPERYQKQTIEYTYRKL